MNFLSGYIQRTSLIVAARRNQLPILVFTTLFCNQPFHLAYRFPSHLFPRLLSQSVNSLTFITITLYTHTTKWQQNNRLHHMYNVPGVEWLLPSPRSRSYGGANGNASQSWRAIRLSEDVAMAMSGMKSLRTLSLQILGSFCKQQKASWCYQKCYF